MAPKVKIYYHIGKKCTWDRCRNILRHLRQQPSIVVDCYWDCGSGSDFGSGFDSDSDSGFDSDSDSDSGSGSGFDSDSDSGFGFVG